MLSKCIDSGYLVGATPLTVFLQLFWNFADVFGMEWRYACRQWVPCGCNSTYSFPSIVLKLCRCFWHGMKMCMWFRYNTLVIFSHFFCYVNLVSFLTWNAIKVYRQWVPCGCNSSYSFALIVLKLCRCFLHGMKMCMWFWYNPWIFFSLSFQFLVTNLSFSSDSTVAGL